MKVTLQLSKLANTIKDPLVATETLRNKANSSMRMIATKLDQLQNRIAGQSSKQVIIKDFHTIGSVGASGNYAAGHRLTLNSFTGGTPLGLWPLGDVSDISPNSNDLTDINTCNFGSTDFMGGTDAVRLVNPANSECLHTAGTDFDDTGSFTAGGWFRLLDTGATEMMMSKYDGTNANKSWWLYQSIAGTIEFRVFTDNAGVSYYCDLGDFGYLQTDEQHFYIVRYDQTQRYISIFIDGHLRAHLYNSALNTRNNSANVDFTIGAYDGSGTPTQENDCVISDCFYCDWAMTQKEIDRLNATKYVKPQALQGKDYELYIKGRETGSASYEVNLSPGGMFVSDDISGVYRYRDILSKDEKIKIYGRIM